MRRQLALNLYTLYFSRVEGVGPEEQDKWMPKHIIAMNFTGRFFHMYLDIKSAAPGLHFPVLRISHISLSEK